MCLVLGLRPIREYMSTTGERTYSAILVQYNWYRRSDRLVCLLDVVEFGEARNAVRYVTSERNNGGHYRSLIKGRRWTDCLCSASGDIHSRSLMISDDRISRPSTGEDTGVGGVKRIGGACCP